MDREPNAAKEVSGICGQTTSLWTTTPTRKSWSEFESARTHQGNSVRQTGRNTRRAIGPPRPGGGTEERRTTGRGKGTTPARGEGRGSSSVQLRGVELNLSGRAGLHHCIPEIARNAPRPFEGTLLRSVRATR
ncbi:hypothetical protein GCM10023108_05360 [Saccharopolyspora hordei]